MSNFVVAESDGYIVWSEDPMGDRPVYTQVAVKGARFPGSAWVINGEEMLPVLSEGRWCVIYNEPRARVVGESLARFDTVEEAVVYCNLMDNT